MTNSDQNLGKLKDLHTCGGLNITLIKETKQRPKDYELMNLSKGHYALCNISNISFWEIDGFSAESSKQVI